MSSSSSSSSAPPSVLSVTRSCLQLASSEHATDLADMLKTLFVYLHAYRQIILQPMAELDFPKCDAAAMTVVWDSRIESRLVSVFGAAAQSDAPPATKSKQCGPLLHALMPEWKQKISAGQMRGIADVLDAMSSARMLEWHNKYAESFHAMGVLPQKHKTAAILSSVLQVMFREQSARVRAGSKMIFTSSACIDEWTALTTAESSRIYLTLHELALVRGTKGMGLLNNGQVARIINSSEIAAKQHAAQTKVHEWLELTYTKSSSKHQFAIGAAESSESSQRHRTCKYADCSDPHGIDIDPSAKYVCVRCSHGCSSTYHPQCYQAIEAELTENDDGIACTRREDRQCEGSICKATLKQQGKFLSALLSVDGDDDDSSATGVGADGDPSLSGSDSEEDEFDSDSPDGHAAPSLGSATAAAAVIASASIKLGLVSRRYRHQRSIAFWSTQPRARLKKVLNSRVREAEMRAEKKQRDAEEKKKEADAKKEETDAKREDDHRKKVANPVPTVAAASLPPTKKSTGFQVVVPISAAAAAAAAAAPAASTATAKAPSSVPRPLTFGSSVGASAPPVLTNLAAPSWPHAAADAIYADDEREEVNGGFSAFIHVKTKTKKAKKAVSSSWDDHRFDEADEYTHSSQVHAHRSQVADAAASANAKASASAPPPSSAPVLLHGRTKEEIEEGRRLKRAARQQQREDAARAAAAAIALEAEIMATPLVIDATPRPSESSSTSGSSDEDHIDDQDGSLEGREGEPDSHADAPGGVRIHSPSAAEAATAAQNGNNIDHRSPSSSTLKSSPPRAVSAHSIGSSSALVAPSLLPPPPAVASAHASTMAAAILAPTSARALPMASAAAAQMAPTMRSPPVSSPHSSVHTPAPMPIVAPTPIIAPPMPIAAVHVAPVAPPSFPLPAVTATATPPAAAPVVGPLSSLQLVDDILAHPASSGTVSSVLLLRHLPSCITVQMLGSLFCPFGKLRVHLALTRQHGLTGVVQYLNAAAATAARNAMSERVYQIDTVVAAASPEEFDSVDYEQWRISGVEYAQTPIRTVAMPQTRLRLVDFRRKDEARS